MFDIQNRRYIGNKFKLMDWISNLIDKNCDKCHSFFDVFAGTGSLGLECASRGAAEVYLVDKSPVTFPLLKQNVENLKYLLCLHL